MNEKGNPPSRIERDELGEVQISSHCYYGIKTARAKTEWFSLGVKPSEDLIKAYLYIKQAYAQAHDKLGALDPQICHAIMQACEEMRAENNHEQFIAEPLQSISGITINANVNEVIANRAEEILGGKPGEYKIVKPEQHVNLDQEVNSLFFLVTQLAVLLALTKLEPEILNLERLLRRDALTLAKVLKVSAMPNIQSTTGQWGKRLNVFATDLEIAIKRIRESAGNLQYEENQDRENTQATKEGNDSQTVEKLMLHYLTAITGFKLKEQDWQASNNGQSEFVVSDLVFVSSALKDLATVLSKVAHVVKIAHSGPTEDQSKEQLSQSSIQIFADSLNMVAYQAVSNNLSLTFLAQCEQLESGTLMPLLSQNLLSTIDLLQVMVVGFQRKGLL
jgi:aspartate ammonia-lyase